MSSVTPISKKLFISDAHILLGQFLKGNIFSLKVSEHIFNSMFKTNNIHYIDCVRKVKKILSASKKVVYKDIYIIKSSKSITEEEKASIIRYINICHYKKQFIIVYNNDVIYIPEEYTTYGVDVVYQYAVAVYKEYLFNRKLKHIVKKLKHVIKKFFRSTCKN